MNKQEQLNSDKKVLASLEAEYNRVRRVTDSVRAFTTDLNFEDLVPDSQERCLMVDQLQAYDYIRINLMNRIRFYRNRVKLEENKEKIAEHMENEQREFMPVLHKMNRVFMADMSDIRPDKFEAFQRGEITIEEMLEGIPYKEVTLSRKKEDHHHCGQDADMDDACCQAREKDTVGDNSAAVNEAQVPNSLKELVGMQIVSVFPPGWKCQGCAYDSDYFRCEKKVELVGGYMICLAQIPIVTE